MAKKRYPHDMTKQSHVQLTRYIVIAMIAGILAGMVWGPTTAHIGFVGTLFIQVIKVVAIPLVFVSIVDAIITTELSWRTARRWLMVVAINAMCALVIGLTLSNVLPVGKELALDIGDAIATPQPAHEFTLQSFVQTLIPASIVEPFLKNNVLGVVVLALLVGAATRSYLNSQGDELLKVTAGRGITVINGIITQLILWLVMIVPLAVFCVTAKTVGQHGFTAFKGLLQYVGIALLGFFIHCSVVYTLWITRIGRISLSRFLAIAHKPVMYAFGTNSSLATLPVTLATLDGIGVKKSASRLGACVGTNFNNDGILLYEVVAVLFVAQAYGIELSLQEQALAAFVSLAASMGVAGIPEAGVVSLSLVLAAVGLPLEVVPLLLTVDWFVARFRSVVNVLSDLTVSIAVSRLT
jgi:Na+/H+-dicarboxylate symporter